MYKFFSDLIIERTRAPLALFYEHPKVPVKQRKLCRLANKEDQIMVAKLNAFAVALVLSVAFLGVIGETAWAISEEKQALERKCKGDWETIEASKTDTITFSRNGKEAVLACQEGYLAAVQKCADDENLKRFRCLAPTSAE